MAEKAQYYDDNEVKNFIKRRQGKPQKFLWQINYRPINDEERKEAWMTWLLSDDAKEFLKDENIFGGKAQIVKPSAWHLRSFYESYHLVWEQDDAPTKEQQDQALEKFATINMEFSKKHSSTLLPKKWPPRREGKRKEVVRPQASSEP